MGKKHTSRPSTTVPSDTRPIYEAITDLTDAFCRECLNEEYAEMCRGLAAALARKRPTPLARGKLEVWACGIIRAIGFVNFLDDPAQKPHVRFLDIAYAFRVADSTAAAKSALIRRMFRLGRFEPKWTLPGRLGDNPRVWMIEVNGIPVDVRYGPRQLQEAAFHKGLIPYIPADRNEGANAQSEQSLEMPDLVSAKAEVLEALRGFQRDIITLMRQPSLDMEKKKAVFRRMKQLSDEIIGEAKRSTDFNLRERLDSAYDEVKRFAERLSSKKGDGERPTLQQESGG